MLATKDNATAWRSGDWTSGAPILKGITVNENAVETINTSNGYTITSANLAELAESAAAWLTDGSRDYASVEALMKTGTATDKSDFVEFIQAEAQDYWQAPTP